MKKNRKKYLPEDKDNLHIFHMDSEEVTRLQMPKYYSASRCGFIGDLKYNRRKAKKDTERLLKEFDM